MGRTTFLLCIAFDLIPPSSTKSCAAKPLDFGVPSGVHSSRWAFDHCADAQEVFGKEVVAERRFFLHGNWTFRSVFDMLKLVKICSCNYCTVVSQPHEIGIFTLGCKVAAQHQCDRFKEQLDCISDAKVLIMLNTGILQY